MTSRNATLTGFGAVALWALLALFTAASGPVPPFQLLAMTFLVAALASWLNWGFGLVIGAVLAREIARQIRVDFAWLVAAAYSGWVIWGSGPSGSIPLSQASHGNVLNIVEKIIAR